MMNTIVKEEGGVSRLWRGNSSTLLRIFPYAAVQFAVYDFLKHSFAGILYFKLQTQLIKVQRLIFYLDQ